MINCPECGESHVRDEARPGIRSDFCSRSCTKRYNNRRALRGAILYDAVMAKRYDRKGEFSGLTEKEARKLVDTLTAEWHAQDLRDSRPRSWNRIADWLARNPWVGNFRKTYKV